MTKLSFPLPNYTSAMNRLLQDVQEGLEQHDEILSQIEKVPVSHGGVTRQVSEPEIVETPMQDFRAMFEIKLDAFHNTDAEQFAESLYNLIEAVHSQQKKYLFEVVGKTTEAVGNVVDAGGKNFWEAYIEMLETLDMTFDEEGKHNYQMYMHPETAKKIEKNPPTPEQLERIEKLMESKRRDYHARKRSRKISE